jgi:hypothetical protein
MLQYLLLSSDPIISHHSRQRLSDYKKKISADVLPLLDEPALTSEKADKKKKRKISVMSSILQTGIFNFFMFTKISFKKEFDYLSV